MSNPAVHDYLDSVVAKSPGSLAGRMPPGVFPDETLALFREIVQREQLFPFFQPIVEVRNQRIFGYEALIRGPAHSALVSPYELFRCARMLSLEDEFEVLCRKLSIREFARSKLPHRLFLNTSPAMLMANHFEKAKTLQFLREFGVDPSRVIIEVTEQQQTSEYALLNEALQQYRELGFQVALDDLGAGYSGLRMWKELLPDFIKIDKHFIRDIHLNKLKQSFIKGLLEISAGSNCRLITEGIEKKGEFEYLHQLGIVFMQGFYFAKPSATPPTLLDSTLYKVTPAAPPAVTPGQDQLHAITRRVTPIAFGTKVKDVLEMLQKNAELDLIPVVNSQRPVGLVERYSFLNKIMKSIYGIALYGKLRIVDFLEREPVVVDRNANLEAISQKVTSHGDRLHGFIVTENDKYIGVSTVLDLLHSITQQQINSARHANPLTLLPGIVPIDDLIDRLLASGKRFAFVYYDLDNFKPYNDLYGYEAGDNVIKQLAEILRTVYLRDSATIGHIGGDDFVVVDYTADYAGNCEQVFTMFSQEVARFYLAEHVDAGGITGIDRQNRPCFFNLLSLSAGVVPPEVTSTCHSHIETSDHACEAKKLAKKRDGNSLFINRRSSGS